MYNDDDDTDETFWSLPDDDEIPDDYKVVVARLSSDLREASETLSETEARYLVKAYYSLQDERIRCSHRIRKLSEFGRPHIVISWLETQSQILEDQIRAALDRYSRTHRYALWARCAPSGSLVRISNEGGGKEIPIEMLRRGDMVTSFNRHKSAMTRPRVIDVAMRPYDGDLIGLTVADRQPFTTPSHRWLVRLNRRDVGFSVYLMRSGDRWRVGRCNLFTRRGKDYLRLGIMPRSRQERASVWILQLCSTETEAAIYEQFIAAEYGIPEWMFRATSNNLITDDAITALYTMLDCAALTQRALKCLRDHNLESNQPIWSWTGTLTKQSGSRSLETAAANLIPEIMAAPVPLRNGRCEWQTIRKIERKPYSGPVYSLDVAEHHKYVQDGAITCNSIAGIGPVIAAGLIAHTHMDYLTTAGHLWSFAGLNPKRRWIGRAEAEKIVSGVMKEHNENPRMLSDEAIIDIAGIINSRPELLFNLLTDKNGKIGTSRNEVIHAVAKRPFNADLKKLAWKVGESFVKVQSNKNDTYGKIYKTQKAIYIKKNESGGFVDNAQLALQTKNWDHSTDAYKAYISGKLPPAHIHAMARRYCVKLFLAHYWEQAWCIDHPGQQPVAPYPIVHLGHAHVIPLPNRHLIAEAIAREAARKAREEERAKEEAAKKAQEEEQRATDGESTNESKRATESASTNTAKRTQNAKSRKKSKVDEART